MEIGKAHHGKHQAEISRKKHHGHKKEEYSMEPKDNTSFGQSVQNDPTKELSEMKKKIESNSTGVTGGISQGTAEKGGTTVEIGSYNMEWLGDSKEKPRNDKDYAMLAQVIKDSGVEVMGIQEIADEKGLQKVVSNLPGFDYILGTTGIRDNGKKQFIGIIYNTEKVQCDKSSVKELKEAQVPHLMGDNHLRAPLIVDMKADNFSFTLVNVHMKSKRGEKGGKVSVREEQAKVINKWMKEQIASGKDKDIILVGDCNDFLDSKCMKTLTDGVMQFATEEAKAKGEYSNIPWKSLIDQIGITVVNINGGPVGGAVANYIKDSTHVFDTRKYPNHKKWGSDHMPVVASFKTDVDVDG